MPSARPTYDLVIAANRLPVDKVVTDTGEVEWRRSPGGLVTAMESVMRSQPGAWVGWAGDTGEEASEPFDEDGIHLRPGAAVGRRGARLLRGLLQRHAVADLPRRHRAGLLPPRLVVELPDRQPALRRGRRRGGGRGRPRVGAGLPAPARAGPRAQAAPRRAHRVVQPHPLPSGRALRPAALAHPAARRPPRGRLPRLPAPGRLAQLRARVPPAARRPHEARHRHRRGQPSPGACGRHPHLRRLQGPRGARPATGRHGASPRDPRQPGRPRGAHARRRPARLHQGHPAPAQGLRGAAQRAPHRPAGGDPRAGRHAEPRARRRLPQPAQRDRADRGPHQRRARQDRLAGGALPAPLLPARGDGGPLPGGRRHARDAAARRHEPRRQGVRHVPPRPRRRARAVGVHRRLARAAPGLRLQPARHRGPQADHPARHQHPGQGQAAHHAGPAPPGLRPRRAALGRALPRRPRRSTRPAPPRPRRRVGSDPLAGPGADPGAPHLGGPSVAERATFA